MARIDDHDPELVLAGDVGGTKTTLGLFAGPDQELQLLSHRTYATQPAASLTELIELFLMDVQQPRVTRACFGVAGPVKEGVADIINLPWLVEAHLLRKHFGWRQVAVINDLMATATAIPFLHSDQILILQEGNADHKANIGLLAAGTGLGEAFLVWNGVDHLPVPSEGGHKDFAPQNERECRLLQNLSRKFGHVSVERILSGQGFVHLYEFLRNESGEPEPDWLSRELAHSEPARVISSAGLAEKDPVCQEALAMFVQAYGAEAGNLALQFLTYGGVYIGGGIAPKLKAALTNGLFMRTFLEKGRLRPLLSRIPVRLITDPLAPLWGAAIYARMYGSS